MAFSDVLCGCKDLSTWDLFYFLRHMSRELDVKWSSRACTGAQIASITKRGLACFATTLLPKNRYLSHPHLEAKDVNTQM